MSQDPAKVVLTALLTHDVQLVDEISRSLTEHHFVDPILRSLYRGILTFRSVAGGLLTSAAVEDLVREVDAGTAAVVRESYIALSAVTVTSSDARWATRRLRSDREQWLTTTLLRDASEILNGSVTEENGGRVWSGATDAREWAAARMAEVAAETAIDDSPAGDVSTESRDVILAYRAAKLEDRSRRPLLGIPKLDEVTGGFGPGEMIVVAAPSGLGKSHSLISLAYHAVALQGLHVYFATSETVRSTVRWRFIARHSRADKFKELREHLSIPYGLDSNLLKRGELPDSLTEFFALVVQDLARLPGSLWLAQMPHGQTMPALDAQVRQRSRSRKIDLLAIDYVALMSGEAKRFVSTREEYVALIKGAKHLAIDYDNGRGLSLVTPWQINRSSQEEMDRTGEVNLRGLAETSEIVNSQPLHAKVLTPTGFVSMGDLKVGDAIVDPEGYPSKIEAVYPLGIKDTYRITFADGGVAESSIDHLWKVRGAPNNRVTDGGWRVLRLGDFAPGVPRIPASPLYPNRPRDGSVRRAISTMIAPDFDDVGERLLDPYLLGLLLGDGSLSDTQGGVKFSSCDIELINSLESLLPLGMRLSNRRDRFVDHAKWSKLTTVGISSVEMKRPGGNVLNTALRIYGLWGCGSLEKFVPVEYKMAPVSVRLAILQGLMDTDGTTGSKDGQGKANVFVSVSEQLRDDVVWLARSLGCKVSGLKKNSNVYYTSGEERIKTKDSYRCLIVPSSEIQLFRLSRKVSSQRKYLTDRPVRPIKSVELVGQHEHQCIRVSAASSLYVTDDFTVTHNTPDIVLALSPDGTRDGRFANMRLGILKNRDGNVLLGGDAIPVRMDYATSYLSARVSADSSGSEDVWGSSFDDAGATALLLGGV